MKFKHNRKSAAVYVVFLLSLSLLLALGTWQWRRGMEKSAIEKIIKAAGDQPLIIDKAADDWSRLAYREVTLHGEWLTDNFLLANKVHNRRVGYEVFTPLRLHGDGSVLLVNRGWVADGYGDGNRNGNGNAGDSNSNDGYRNTDGNGNVVTGTTVTGKLYLPQKGFTLGDAFTAADKSQPQVIQYLDLAAIAAAINSPLQPTALALAADHPAAFTPIWQPYPMPPARHYAYAAQWWALAATLLIFGIIWRRRSLR